MQGTVEQVVEVHATNKKWIANGSFISLEFGGRVAKISIFPGNFLTVVDDFRGQHYCINNFDVTSTTAEVRFNFFGNFFAGRIWVFVQQQLGSGKHSRAAKTALYGACRHKGLAKNSSGLSRDTFEGDDGCIFQLTHGFAAGKGGFAI